MKRTTLAYVLAPPAAGVAFFFISLFHGISDENSFSIGTIAAVYSYVPSLIVAAPTHFILRKLNKESLINYMAVGVLVPVISILVSGGFKINYDILIGMGMFAFACGLVAACFSVIKNGWSNHALDSIGTSSAGPERVS